MPVFDDGRLEDEAILAAHDAPLRELANAGARVRIEVESSIEALGTLETDLPPRAVVAAGEDARLLRAVLEPWCPVPFVAWPGPGLPGWTGSLDLVVVLGPGGGDAATAATLRDAVHRGCSLVVACPARSMLGELVVGRHRTLLPTETGDPLAAAVVMLQTLHLLGVGPTVDADEVARTLDDVAIRCSPHRDVALNPAKEVALAFGDLLPLIWGGSVLAARAARRVAETFRRTTGRPALAADASHLLPVIDGAAPRDVFADPFADPVEAEDAPTRPGLLVLGDGTEEPALAEARGTLTRTAAERRVRTHELDAAVGSVVARYAELLSTGSYAAVYLGIGLGAGRVAPPPEPPAPNRAVW